MPDDEETTSVDEDASAPDEAEPEGESSTDEGDSPRDDQPPAHSGGRIISVYGIASAVLGIASVVAIVLGLMIWSAHRDDEHEREYQGQVLRAAGSWASVLINLTAGDIDANLSRLRDKTTGQLQAQFDTEVQPYKENLVRLQSRSLGRIESLALQTLNPSAGAPGAPPTTEPQPPSDATRTDTVLVVATSRVENPAAKIRGVHWQLYLDVSDVGGKQLISRLGSF